MKKIIIDTDIGTDCDDAGALAILENAGKQGAARLLAVTLSTQNPYASRCAEAIIDYYGDTIPIGITQKNVPGEKDAPFENYYGKYISDKFSDKYSSAIQKQEAVSLLRKVLAENIGEKIILIGIGPCINLAGLIESHPDKYSEKSGIELLCSSVQKIVMMGCRFSENGSIPEPEYNIYMDIDSAKTLFDKCPVPIIVSHFSVGENIFTGKRLIAKEPANPVAEAYRFHSNGNRNSWDPITAFYALNESDRAFSLSHPGEVSIHDNGVSFFLEGGRKLHHLLFCTDENKMQKLLDSAMCGEFIWKN